MSTVPRRAYMAQSGMVLVVANKARQGSGPLSITSYAGVLGTEVPLPLAIWPDPGKRRWCCGVAHGPGAGPNGGPVLTPRCSARAVVSLRAFPMLPVSLAESPAKTHWLVRPAAGTTCRVAAPLIVEGR